ncbi:MAG: tripartite tricarboxylate transporter substrate binding protein [Pseudomonadota bacterium]
MTMRLSKTTNLLRGLFLLLLAGALSTPSRADTPAQNWPDRPVKFISSQSAGGATDIICRIVADQLSTRIGKPVIVENRPGGGNVIGTQAAARSAPDGYTFFFATAAALVTDPYTFKGLPYDPMKDFVVISKVAEVSFFVLAHPSVEAKTLPELFALVKAAPDKYSIATDGPRRFTGMIASWLTKLAGVPITQVPYSNMNQGIQDVIAGRVPLLIQSVPASAAAIGTGALKPLAVTSLKRLPSFPNVPTVAETFPGFDFTGWMVLAAPAGTPPEVLARVNKEMDGILKDQAVVTRLAGMNFFTEGSGTQEQARAYVRSQYEAWGKLVREIGLQPE